MRRAAVSVASNIAEAAGRASLRDGARFLSIACGSASELRVSGWLVGDLGFVERQRETLVSINEVQKMLKSLIVSWSKNSPPEPPRIWWRA